MHRLREAIVWTLAAAATLALLAGAAFLWVTLIRYITRCG